MTVERLIRIMAGTVVLISLALGYHGSPIFVSEWFLALTAFAGFNRSRQVVLPGLLSFRKGHDGQAGLLRGTGCCP